MRVWSVPILSASSTSDESRARELRRDADGRLYDLGSARCHELPSSLSTRAQIWLPVLIFAPLIGAALASIPVVVMDGISTTLGWGPAVNGSLWSRPFDHFHLIGLVIFLLLTLVGVRLVRPPFEHRVLDRQVRAELGVDGTARLQLVAEESWEVFLADLTEPTQLAAD